MSYHWTPKGYAFSEQDYIDPNPVYAVGEGESEPVLDAEDPELYDNWLEACDVAHDDALFHNRRASVWCVSPETRMIAMFYPCESDDK